MVPKVGLPKEKINIRPGGDTFLLLAWAELFGRDLGYSDEARKKIYQDLMSGDYQHLEKTFVRHFGEYCELVTANEKNSLAGALGEPHESHLGRPNRVK